jgi:hypothetical protein
MNEDFLHYIFEHQLLQNTDFEILSPGLRNPDAGPDFFNAKIKIGETIWAGNVEIHLKASDWYLHNHHKDKSYDNIILHLVLIDDKTIMNSEGRLIPSFEVKFDQSLHNKYLELIHSKQWIHCDNHIRNIDSFTINTFIDSLAIERLERKSEDYQQLVAYNNNDWENSFFQAICKGFGGKINQIPFELLAKQIDYKILLKHRDSLIQIEAFLYGIAGLLNGTIDDAYLQELRSEFQFLKHKYQLQTIRKELIKYSKIRPYNFPDIRLALLSQLIFSNESLLSVVTETQSIEQLEKIFQVEASEYWATHYKLGISSKKLKKQNGKASIQHLIINTIVPFLYNYADKTGRDELKERCISWLTEMQAEQNNITKQWEKRGLENTNALQSQGLIELKNEKCIKHQCIHCRIGHKILTLTWHG